MKITVCGLLEAAALLKNDRTQFTRIVTLLDDADLIATLGDHHLKVEISDIVKPLSVGLLLRGTALEVVPAHEHLLAVLEHTKDLTEEDHVLVHCAQGISRSSAMAIAILIQNGMSYMNAYNHINRIRPQMDPNKKIIELTDAYFNLNNELIKYDWKQTRIKRDRY